MGLARLLAAALCAVASSPASSQQVAHSIRSASLHGGPIAALITESARRFRLPEGWIAAVMRAESNFNPHATSVKGAMGLMQLMPATYAGMRARYGLGGDPYDAHDNVLAGVAYLRGLYDQFGVPGLLAAYNAGPARYLDFLARGRPLPDETQRYVAVVTASIVGQTGAHTVLIWRKPPAATVFAPIEGSVGAGAADRLVWPEPAKSLVLQWAQPGQSVLFISATNQARR